MIQFIYVVVVSVGVMIGSLMVGSDISVLNTK